MRRLLSFVVEQRSPQIRSLRFGYNEGIGPGGFGAILGNLDLN